MHACTTYNVLCTYTYKMYGCVNCVHDRTCEYMYDYMDVYIYVCMYVYVYGCMYQLCIYVCMLMYVRIEFM